MMFGAAPSHDPSKIGVAATGVPRFARLDVALGWATEIPAAILVAAEIIVLLAGVVSRYIVQRPLVWTDELASALFLWLAMLGAVIALRRDEHMRLTALLTRAPARWRSWLEAVGAMVARLMIWPSPRCRPIARRFARFG